MARLNRLALPGVLQHVIQRGNNKQACFWDKEDYQTYLEKLDQYTKQYRVALHAYVLMPNHVHLLFTPSTERGGSQLMQALGRYYVRYINAKYQRSGTLWEGRYRSTLVDADNYFLLLSRYIEMNPVRAGLVDVAAQYPWSSYRGNALYKHGDLLQIHRGYEALGVSDDARKQTYRMLFKFAIPDPILTEIREATNKGWVLGDDHFKKEVEEKTGRRASPLGRGGDRKSAAYRASRQKTTASKSESVTVAD